MKALGLTCMHTHTHKRTHAHTPNHIHTITQTNLLGPHVLEQEGLLPGVLPLLSHLLSLLSKNHQS